MAGLFLRFLTVGGMVTVVMLPLLLGHTWLERRYAPQTRWLLWLTLAGVLLAAPLLPHAAAPVQVEVPAYALPLERTVQAPSVSGPAGNDPQWEERPEAVGGEKAPAHTGVGTVTETSQAAPVGRRVARTGLAALVWLGVAALLLTGEGLRYCLIRQRMMKASRPLEREEARLRVLPGLGSPVTVGFCRPVVFLPAEETDPMALRHELTHIERRDIWGKALLFLACALYWFHPLVWLMARRADRDVEAACDAQMAEGLSPAERRAYGELLLASAGEARALPFATRFGGSKEQMKARLTQLFRPGKRSRTLVCVLLATALLLSGLVACREAEEGAVPDGTEFPTPSAVVIDGPETPGPSPSAGAVGGDVVARVVLSEDLIRAEHAEMERLRNLALDPELDLSRIRWFTREELAAVGYPLEEGQEGLACFEVKIAPAGREELMEALYDQFESELAETLADDCLGGSWPLCFFADGKLWHRGEYGTVWFEYDWNSLRVLNSNDGQIEYTLDGYSNVNNSGETPERKRWYFTLKAETSDSGEPVFRYADTGREIFNEDKDNAPTYEEWAVEYGRAHPGLSGQLIVMREEDGTIWAWGVTRYGQLDSGQPIIDMKDGSVWVWGNGHPENTGLPGETE